MIRRAPVVAYLLFGLAALQAGTFSDTFSLPNGSAPALWGNESGGWVVTGGVYDATAGTPYPNAHSLLPWTLTDFTLEVDTNNNGDGGVWLRASDAPGTTVGVMGVLFVFRASDMYFHDVTDGSTYDGSINAVGHATGAHHLYITVAGNTYTATMDPGTSNEVTTSYSSTSFSSGQAGLYDYSPLGLDNFTLDGDGVNGVPEPASAALTLFGTAALAFLARRRRRA